MSHYILKRCIFLLPTLLGILFINFCIIQLLPGGPMDHAIGTATILAEERSTVKLEEADSPILPNQIHQLQQEFGLHQPWWKRFGIMVKNYLTFDFGKSYFQDSPVIDLILEKLPVTLSLGIWSVLLIYIFAVPLGIAKALHHGSRFDTWSTTFLMIGYSLPTFLLGFLLILFFASGEYWEIFPLQGLSSIHGKGVSWFTKMGDYFYHLCLPVLTILLGGMAHICLLTKNAFLEELQKNYVITARAKGLNRQSILYHHIAPNAMLVLLVKLPQTLLHILVGGNLVIEIIFGLDGLGLLAFSGITSRDYPIMLGTLYIYTLTSLILHIVGDILYKVLDPRISFGKK